MKTLTEMIRSLFGAVLLLLAAFTLARSVSAQTVARITFQAPVTVQTSRRSSTTYQQIFSVNPDGTGVAQLTTTSANSLGPRWSPTQAYISFCRAGALWVMQAQGEANGGQSFAVAAARGGADWSSDGSTLVFQGTNEGLYLVPINPSVETAAAPVLLHAGSWWNPSWSPDGTKIAANGSDDGSSNIIGVFDALTGAELATFASPSPNVARYPSFAPQWSPDGARIAFSGPVIVPTRKGTTSYQEIFLANPDCTGLTRVTYLNSFCDFPTWSSDGATLAFRCDISGMASVYTMPLGSSTLTLIHSPGNNLDWNP